jgi:hypothetical protein
MRTDTLTYTYQMQTTPERFYQVMVAQQEAFFRSKGLVEPFGETSQINLMIRTKAASTLVPAVMRVQRLAKDEVALTTAHEQGEISQSYQFVPRKEGTIQVTYSEQNYFDRSRNTYSFMLMALFYKFFFNRGVKKRMKYLEATCQQGANPEVEKVGL